MDRKTLIAVVLSVVIIVGGMALQAVLFPPKPAAPTQTTAAQAGTPANGTTPAAQQTQSGQSQTAPATTTAAVAVPGTVVATPESAPPASQGDTIMRETDLFKLIFASNGATLSSVELKKFKNVDGTPVDMVMLPKTPSANEMPFAISFGDYKTAEVTVPFVLHETVDGTTSTFDFTRTFLSPTGIPFILHKTYVFVNGEYIFDLHITIENSVNDFPSLDFGGHAYTLTLGPQIGPHYTKLDGRNDLRQFAFYENGKRQNPNVGMGQLKESDKRMTWTGIVGKYFTAIAIPDATEYHTVYDSRKLVDGFDRSTIAFERPTLKTAKSTDVFRFYMGPLKSEILARYNDAANNKLGISGLNADKVITSSILIGWLAVIFKYALDFFYFLIPNYGIAIILLTLLTKVVFLPLTFKSSESMAKMAALNPKMAEIRERLKDKPDKMNQEIAQLYQKEKVNPLSGCLPMLLQIPVFFALYNLLNSHFELRGALFIPGWIPDLSAPESILNFAFSVPLLGWTALRLLPIIMLASQLLSGKFTQPSSAPQQGGAQAKLLMYAMPIVFFFILYDMPSGLVLYWTAQNIFSTIQQVYINSLNKKKAAQAQPPAAPQRYGKQSGAPTRRLGK